MHSHNLQRRQRLLKAVSATCRPEPWRCGPRKDADLETGADRRKPAGREGICKADRKQGQERRSGFLPHHLRKPTLGQMGAPPAVTGGFSRCRLTATSSRLRLSLSASSCRARRKSTEGPSFAHTPPCAAAVAIPILRAGKFCRRGPNRRHAKRNGKPIPGGLLALPPC